MPAVVVAGPPGRSITESLHLGVFQRLSHGGAGSCRAHHTLPPPSQTAATPPPLRIWPLRMPAGARRPPFGAGPGQRASDGGLGASGGTHPADLGDRQGAGSRVPARGRLARGRPVRGSGRLLAGWIEVAWLEGAGSRVPCVGSRRSGSRVPCVGSGSPGSRSPCGRLEGAIRLLAGWIEGAGSRSPCGRLTARGDRMPAQAR